MKYSLRPYLTHIAFFSIFLLFFSCGRELFHPDESILEKAIGVSGVRILSNKKYNVTEDKTLENIVFSAGKENYYLSLFHKKGKREFSYLGTKSFPIKDIEFLKMVMVNPAIGYSHIFLFFKKGDKPYIHIVDWDHFEQTIPLSMDDLSGIELLKNSKKPGDEYLSIKGRAFRFDSMQYVEIFPDAPLPFFLSLSLNREDLEEPGAILRNNGEFTASTVLTLSFPDLNSANFYDFVQTLPKNNLRVYLTGRKIHHADIKTFYAKYPMVEIQGPLKNMETLRLYLRAKKDPGKIHIRAVMQKAGQIIPWPPMYLLDKTVDSGIPGKKVTLDQQGYPAYEIEIHGKKP